MPMASQGSLRRRIVTAYVFLACVVCSFFGLAAFAAIRSIENVLIDSRLSRAADQLIDGHWQGLPQHVPPNVEFFQGSAVPAALQPLSAGLHELSMGDKALHVLVRESRGERFVLTDDESDFESIEVKVYQTLVAAFVACLALAVLIGRLTASRVIAPVTALARAVEQDDGAREFPSLRSTDEMGVLSRAFAARTDELNGFLQRERWFVGDVSHELRTPLMVMLGAAEVLRARLADRPDLLPVVERVRRTAVDAAERVAALLLLSRAPEAVDAPRTALTPIIRQEMERCQPLLDGKALVLRLMASAEIYVFARPELAAIAIGNLIRNACQATEVGHVEIALEATRLVVEDTGPGIPAAIRTRLFQGLVRTSDDSSTGSGLGLAIVGRVAEKLGWVLSLEERPGGGSRFILALPTQS